MVRFVRELRGWKLTKEQALKRLRFPRYTEEESIVAKEFIKQWENDNDEFWFSVHIPSERAKWVLNAPPFLRYFWEEVTAKRIDLVIVSRNVVHIVEFKRYMLASGIGQLLLYRDMFLEYYKPDAPVELWYAVWYWDPDVAKKCEREGIKWWSYIK